MARVAKWRAPLGLLREAGEAQLGQPSESLRDAVAVISMATPIASKIQGVETSLRS